MWYKGGRSISREAGKSGGVEKNFVSAEPQQTIEQPDPDKDTLRELQEEIRRRDGEIDNIEFELRLVEEVMRRRNLSPPS